MFQSDVYLNQDYTTPEVNNQSSVNVSKGMGQGFLKFNYFDKLTGKNRPPRKLGGVRMNATGRPLTTY